MTTQQNTKRTFGIRIDERTYGKLRRIANLTDRSLGSVVRILIRRAEVGSIQDVVLPRDRGAQTQDTQEVHDDD